MVVIYHEIYPTSLGNYFVLYQLERNDDTLTFVEQNITVSLSSSTAIVMVVIYHAVSESCTQTLFKEVTVPCTAVRL